MKCFTVFNIWRVKKTAGGWSKPRLLDAPVNTNKTDTWPSVSNDGTLYFFSSRKSGVGKDDIYRSPLINGEHSKVENLGNVINTVYYDVDPFIAPDESYLIYCSINPGGLGKFDLYISFQIGDTWSKPVNMGKGINSPDQEERPYVTADGKYLFFTSTRSSNLDIYWVNAEIIEQFRPN